MRIISAYLKQKQAVFSQHPFFERLKRKAPLHEVLPFAKAMTFWVMAFQDILRLNETHVTDPMLKRVAHGHRAEDAGHEAWFLHDLLTVEDGLPDVCFLFSRSHAKMRDVSYQLVSEVFRAKSDIERIALVLTLESTGHIFFEHISNYLESSEFPDYQLLFYFTHKHLDVELDHDVFEEEKKAFLENYPLTPEQEKNCFELVDRAYEAFTSMFDHLEQVIQRSQSEVTDLADEETANVLAA